MPDLDSGAGLPAGTVTFLLSEADCADLWERAATVTEVTLGRHRRLVADAVRAHAGVMPAAQRRWVVIGDVVIGVVGSAADAVAAALDAQRAPGAEL